MTRFSILWKGILMTAFIASLWFPADAEGGDIGFIEDFALARDRSEALKQLIPGTEDYYYYFCLHYLNSGQYAKAEQLTKPWLERFGQTQRLVEIQTRHALLAYEKDPKRTLAYLKDRLGLRFDHQKEILGAAPNLPTALDPKRIARATLLADSLRRWNNLDNFEDSAFDWLSSEDLKWERRRNLLQRLQRPDVPDLVSLIVEDLKAPHAPEFGSYPVHRQLTLSQLEELVKLQPDLLNKTAFVQAYLVKLQPGPDEDWRRDRKLTEAYLDRLQKFVVRLAPVHNPLKAHVLYHRLALDRSQGIHDAARFLAYLALPRFQPYMAKALNEAEESRRHPADLNADFSPLTLLPVVRIDEPLVRAYLKHFFTQGKKPADYEPYINDVYLTHLHAENQIENGQGDPETWASKLPPEQFRQLKDRIDIDFAFTNKTDFAADEPVRLDLFVKNVPTLLVKVFEINTRTLYRTQLREIDTDLNLDGLVANSEKAHTYEDSPLRRVARRFEFPELQKPGVYIVDFIGSGKSSRALIRKGRLRPVVTTGTAGQMIRVLDDQNKPVEDAVVWLGGVEYRADKEQIITVPFTAQPGRRPIVLSKGDFSSLDYLDHQPEAYRLAAGIHVDRESLLTQKVAPLLVRPGLFLNDNPVSLKLLEDVKLRIVSVDHGDIPASVEVPHFPLFEDRESIHEIRVPGRLKSLQVTLTARVKSLTTGQPVQLAVSQSFALNEIERTDKIEDLHLARFGSNYVVEVRGRTGEVKPDRPVQVALKHRDFRELIQVTLKTDPQGRVQLGPLAEIVTVQVTGPESTSHSWNLATAGHTYRQVIHSRSGAPIVLPYVGEAKKAGRDEFALFEMRGETIQSDRFSSLALQDGQIVLRELPPGDYDLWLKSSGERIRVRVVDGPVQDGFVLGTTRHLQLPRLAPLSIASITTGDEEVNIQLGGSTPFARVHVFATRYQPAFSAYANLSRVRDAGLGGVVPAQAESVYLTGRNIGDEYRYVLDRRGLKKYPGNMLERPSLLLNPWALRTTETGEQVAASGEAFGARGMAAPSRPIEAPPESASKPAPPPAGGDFANLDFLANASAVLVNLVPDKNGVVRVARKNLAPHSMVYVVAVDPLATTWRSLSLPEQKTAFADLRFRLGLDPAKRFTQQKQISVLPTGKALAIPDLIGSRFQLYDSLPAVYSYYSTLSKDPQLAEFSFLLTWPKRKTAEKRELYSKYACHELNFFLYKKDRAFFDEVVKPFLANKKDKTFLDHWLLDEDLAGYAVPWSHGRLNTVERVLLAQRLPGEPVKTGRHLDDMLRLLPPNVDRQQYLFQVGIDLTGLQASDSLSRTIQDQRLRMEERAGEKGRLKEMQLGAEKPGTPPVVTMPASEPGGMPGTSGKSMKRESLDRAGFARDAEKDKAEPLTLADEAKKADSDGKRSGMSRSLAEGREQELLFYRQNMEQRKQVRQLYRKLDPTQEWAENNYYHLPIQRQVADLVPVGQFWKDYVQHDGKTPFLSRHLGEAARNFTEMMFALSVLDLPFESGKHDVKFADGGMTLTPVFPVIAFHEEVRPADDKALPLQILVSQNFYRNGERYRDEAGERLDKFITDEFLVQTVYGCQVVVTNATSSRQKLTVLVQIPIGAIPVANGQATRSLPLDLEPYRTQTIDYFFYFPAAGKYAHFPVQVAKNERFVAGAQPFPFNVVEKPSRVDTGSWDYLSQNGSDEEVLAFLNRENVRAVNLERIAFRMKDRAFFESVLKLLDGRHVFQPTLWSYALLHNDLPAAQQYLQHAEAIVASCGGPIRSPLLTVDPVARHLYEHLEYKPLVNARVHSLGKRRQIVNDAFHQQYHRFLKVLSYHPDLDDNDLLATTYYLLLQDRIDEARAAFDRVNPERIATRLQYDYCAAYLAMYEEQPQKARTLAARHANHPVDRWRNTFATILAQVDEVEGKATKVVDPADRDQRQGNLAATEPGFEFTLDNKAIQLTWQNLKKVRVNYYRMDVELLFSRSPFVQQSGGQFASIRPNLSKEITLPAGDNKLSVPLPPELASQNVLVEITGAGKSRSLPYYANAMDVKFTENYGQVRVVDAATGKPLPKVYVKVYARLADGSVKFHKDGYTDLRGRMDYVSVNTPERQAISRLAVLVLSEDRGALIRDVAPPQQ